MRVRVEPNTTCKSVGYYEKGYYTCEKVNEDWYKVGDYYMAQVDGVTYLPTESIIEQLKAQIKALESDLEKERMNVQQLKNDLQIAENKLTKIKEIL